MCPECVACVYSIITLAYAAGTSLLRALLDGQSVVGWCLAMDIISTLPLLACGCIYCCAPCYMSILGTKLYDICSNKKKNCALCFVR